MPAFDTSFIVDLLRGNEEALKKLAEMEAGDITLSTTEINVLELYKGAYLSMKTHKNLEEIMEILESFQVLELEESVYEFFASLSANLLSRGRPIGVFDELIAAIVLCHDGKIITRVTISKKCQDLKL
jgi:tRNA(fMet)-specific endonuclease VapC